MATCPFKNQDIPNKNICDTSCALKVNDKCAFAVIAEKLSTNKKSTTALQK